MILIALGANLTSKIYGEPKNTLTQALRLFPQHGIQVKACSRFYKSAPVPASDQPWYVNAVAAVETDLPAAALLAVLHEIEEALGRTRRQRWEARVIDLDLLDYHSEIMNDAVDGRGPQLPHPRLAERAFVLLPLRDVCPNWKHPVLGLTVAALIDGLKDGQTAEAMEPGTN